MELSRIEKQRSSLLQLLLLLVILSLGAVTYISIQKGDYVVIPSLTLFSLIACLFVIAKERLLKRLHAELVEEIVRKEREVKDLNQEVKGGKVQLEEEKQKLDQMELRLKEITSLYRAISTVNSIQDPQRTFDTVLRAALDLVENETGSLMLLDDKTQRLVIVSAQGLRPEMLRDHAQRIGEGIAGWVAKNCEPILVTEESKKDEPLRGLLNPEVAVASSMSIPLHVRERVIGVMNFRISPHQDKKEFSDHDLRLVSIFTQHASVAIENIQLTNTVQKLRKAPQPA
jgi:transcriptional regulator with GAF, ATPase, and Fis domain